MSGKPKDIMEIKQVIQLKLKGYSNRAVGELMNIHRNTVNSYTNLFEAHGLSYQELSGLDEASLRDLFPEHSSVEKGRFEVLAEHFPYFERELKKPGCNLKTLWQEYKANHPEGYQYAQFNLHFKNWQKKHRASGKLEHQAGEKIMVDFTGKKLEYVDSHTGEVHLAEVFVGILPASQFTFVMAVAGQSLKDFIKAMNTCLFYLQGVPVVIIADNLKAAVTKADKYAPSINKTFQDFALHYGCSIAPARPYKPKDKALVEGAVNLVYQRIFYPLQKQTFFSIEEINQAITPLLESYNNYRFQRSKTSRREEFHALEKSLLQPLPPDYYHIRHFKRLKVQFMGHIYLSEDKHYYSAPHQYIGHRVEVQYTSDSVEMFFKGHRIATHKRDPAPGRYTTLPEHRSQAHQAIASQNRDEFHKQAGQIGPYCQRYVLKLIDQYNYPEQGYKQVRGILSLKRHYASSRIEEACRLAVDFSWCSFKTIENILKNDYDLNQTRLFDQSQGTIPTHDNIRGKGAFN